MHARIILLLVPCILLAQPQQSENFRIAKSVIDCGGVFSTSQDFRLTSALGQPSPLGWQSGIDLSLSGGFLSPTFSVSPLSPIQELIIQQINPDVCLAWPRVTGAIRYKVYRSTEPLFTPGPAALLGSASDTSYVDANIVGLPAIKNFYVVTALSGNGLLLAMPRSQDDTSKPAAGGSRTFEQKRIQPASAVSKK